MKDLKGRTAIVTGASTGIGLRVARQLADEGMHLVIAARSASTLAEAAAELAARGARVTPIPTDVTDHAALRRLVDRTLAEFGRIDVLVNNAGIEAFHDFHTLPPEEIVRTVETNLTAALVLTRLVLPHMLAAGAGHVVNMSSTAGKHGPAYGVAYGATKAGLIAVTESLRGEYHGTGISASAVCPGFTDDGGIYERIKRDTGKGTPVLMGATSAAAVARAVVRAIRRDVPEVIINSPPMRPIFALAELFPRLGEWIIRKASVRFLRRAAHSRRSGDQRKRAA